MKETNLAVRLELEKDYLSYMLEPMLEIPLAHSMATQRVLG